MYRYVFYNQVKNNKIEAEGKSELNNIWSNNMHILYTNLFICSIFRLFKIYKYIYEINLIENISVQKNNNNNKSNNNNQPKSLT